MSGTVIKIENLSKLYRPHKQTGSFRDQITQSFKRLWRRNKTKKFTQSNQLPCFPRAEGGLPFSFSSGKGKKIKYPENPVDPV